MTVTLTLQISYISIFSLQSIGTRLYTIWLFYPHAAYAKDPAGVQAVSVKVVVEVYEVEVEVIVLVYQ